jgi:hypothetical protein
MVTIVTRIAVDAPEAAAPLTRLSAEVGFGIVECLDRNRGNTALVRITLRVPPGFTADKERNFV